MGLEGRVVLVTGATGAVGQVAVRAFAKTGARLVLTGRQQEALTELAANLGLSDEGVLLCPADLSAGEDVAALARAVGDRWGGADVLLNIAGGWRGGARVAELTEEEWDAAMDMNLRSAFLICRAVLPHMVSRGWGRIVNVASRAAVEPAARQAAYNASKGGLVALTASISAEYRRQGVAANAILPSIIDTPQNRAQNPDADYSRWVKPESIAAMMLYLCTDEGGALNGAAIPMYGRL
jgi:NAD(P)-dependent dehydrogenase (short-subunit alcohol dehydrogenase family)